MNIELITPDADPNHGGFPARVHGLVRIFAEFAAVRVVLTDWFQAPPLRNVTYERFPVPEGVRSKLSRLRTYYRTDLPGRRTVDPPDLSVVESLDLFGLATQREGVPVILDEHNVWWEVLRYEMVNAPLLTTWIGRRALVRRVLLPRLLARAKAFEVAALERADRTLVTSETDRARILAQLPRLADRIHVLPNCVDASEYDAVAPSPGDSMDVVFVGGYRYVPNREAALIIARTLAPAIPEARFVLVGSDPPPIAPAAPNVAVAGFVPDIRSVLSSAAVCIAPITRGSGTRLKILTYLAAGKAVVATTKACEGLEVRDGEHVLLHDDWDEFARAIRRLLGDAALRRRLGTAGRALVRERYDWRVHVDRMRTVAEDAVRAAGRDVSQG